ncbi:MAG: Stk1 family PASTA domain-containing Ser/Thr kinase [Lachnospiraceae bacterium]|nr:Stk1 family PASTA domain-containing Ser/Thr kinase [Lachnospiraceae bacterium]
MLKEGTVIGERYEVVGRVGSGGMADVYKAKDSKLDRYVAVKVMKQEFNNDSNFIRKFKREAQAAAGLANPNIVNVYDVGDDAGIYYIVMELVEGITLKEYISKKGKLSVRETTSIGIQVCLGLAAAHRRGIVHRDVKPQNIIISTDGKVKVTDFGIARAASSNTISANAMGSVHYSSPEQVRGGYSDARSDIYSVGITLYEMVTGRVPFDGETTVAIAIKHLQDELEMPSKFTPDLPHALEQIIMKCTQKSVDRRYQTMDDVVADLKRSLMEPDGDFVQLAPLSNHAQTVMITPDERAAILEKDAQNMNSVRTYSSTTEAQKDDGLSDEEYEKERYRREIDDEDDVDDSDDDEVGSGLEKAVTIGAFIVGALIILVLVVIIGRQVGLFNFGASSAESVPVESEAVVSAEMVEVPDITGLSEAEAKELANEYNLGIKALGEVSSDDYEAGLIAQQDPAAGTSVEKNSTITYYRSSGSADQIEVPEVIGLTRSEAEDALEAAGFTDIAFTEEDSDEVNAGVVMAVDPSEGETAAADDTITLTVSTGGENAATVVIGNYRGIDAEEAQSLLEAQGLVVEIEYDVSDSLGRNNVIETDPESGTSVRVGSTVTLIVNDSSKADPSARTETSETEETWVSDSTLGRADNYTGGAYRLVLRQEVNGENVDKEIESGSSLEFPYTITVEGVAGISSGSIYLYEETDSGEVARAQWPITFEES